MSINLHTLLGELRSLDFNSRGIRRYYELREDLSTLLPHTDIDEVLAMTLGSREEEFQRALAAYVGDQRAKDLIDRSYSAATSQHAIRLLHRALWYGRVGMQAEKAYEELGVQYEARGNLKRAIFYYTKALALNNTRTASVLWRGELLYQTEQWEAARNDFVHALAMRDTQRFFPDEYARAQQHLADVEHRLQPAQTNNCT